MYALPAPFGMQVQILQPAPGAHFSTGPLWTDRRRAPIGWRGWEKSLRRQTRRARVLQAATPFAVVTAHTSVLHNNRRTLSSDAKIGRLGFRRVDVCAASAVRHAGPDPTAGAGCAFPHRPAHPAPPSAGSENQEVEQETRSSAAASTA